MTKVIISGCNGFMGRTLTGLCKADPELEVVAGVDISGSKLSDFPVYTNFTLIRESADVLIDFSNPAALSGLLEYCLSKRVFPVICSTGYDECQLRSINDAANRIPVFRSGNMSIGINLICELVRQSASLLGIDFDIEIIEKHHNRKVDAPSGTALMLAAAAEKGRETSMDYIYERKSARSPREKNEIGISSVRGGTIPGEHSVIFAGKDEVIEFKHTVYSREVFAVGAVKAAHFLAHQTEPGLYDMSDVVSSM